MLGACFLVPDTERLRRDPNKLEYLYTLTKKLTCAKRSETHCKTTCATVDSWERRVTTNFIKVVRLLPSRVVVARPACVQIVARATKGPLNKIYAKIQRNQNSYLIFISCNATPTVL